jgi:magnesium transporter
VERYKISTLPVVDSEYILEGVISYEDVVEAMEDIADETIAHIAGTHEGVSVYDSISKRILSRSPWLLVTLCAGMLNMANMSYFESLEGSWFIFVFFFVPLILGMSGNVGLQSSAILVRSMATGDVSAGSKSDVVYKEILTGVCIGLIFGVLSGFLVWLLGITGAHGIGIHPLYMGTIVAFGLFGACLAASTLGVLSPFFLARVGVDPAIASGPIVTAFNDLLSTVMYFVIAKLISTLLFAVNSGSVNL